MSELIRRTHDEAGNEYGKLQPSPMPSVTPMPPALPHTQIRKEKQNEKYKFDH